MAWVETRMVRTFRFEVPDDIAAELMKTHKEEEFPMPGTSPQFDAAFQMAAEAFERWNATEDAATPFSFDEVAGCVLGEEILHTFEVVPEWELDDGTTIV